MKIAIVHDYLIDFGGAERVLKTLSEIYPNAPIYVSIYRKSLLGKFADKFDRAKIVESWFGKLPFAEKLISPFRFLLPLIWKSFNLKNYDLIISSSSWAITKGFDKKNGAVEICYCHTPPRYLYDYDTSRKFNIFIKIYALIINGFMRKYDFDSAQKVDYFIANSAEVAQRIANFYHRESTIIYPPASQARALRAGPPLKTKSYYLAGGRLVAAKNFDLIIRAFNRLKFPLKIYGDGVLKNELQNMAGENIEFLGKVDDEGLAKLYQNAKAFVLAQKDEDFGMTAVEAMGFGCPIIAYKGGGYLESVIEKKTGIFFNELNVESLSKAIQQFNNLTIKPSDCITQAKKFSKERFKKEMLEFVQQHARTS